MNLRIVFRFLNLICFWFLTMPLGAGQAHKHENNKPLDMRQIERLEVQLSQIRQRIDQLRCVNDPHTQNVTEHLTRRPPSKVVVTRLIGLWYTNRGLQDDFRVSDRILTVRRINGNKQITGYGVVVRIEDNAMLFEAIAGSSTKLEDEVYVINREDTSANIINILQN